MNIAKQLFDEFSIKFKFLTQKDHDKEVAELLEMDVATYQGYKRRNEIPYERVIAYCEERAIDLNWILNIKKVS